MSPTVAPDISEHNPPVDDSFNRDWLTLRVCFGGGYTDLKAAHNLAWAVKARAAGKIKGFGVYVVYLPGENAGVLAQLDKLAVPADCVVMVDAEKWGGAPYQINGDHSAEINDLADKLRARQSGRADLVWAYGNRGPDLEVWPNKPGWLGWVVASYGGSKPDVPNLIGWQYTDGQPEFDKLGRPHSTKPFGRCDHNYLYNLPASEVDPLADLTPAQLAEIAQAVWQYRTGQNDADGDDWQMQTYVRNAKVNAGGSAKVLGAPDGVLARVAALQAANTALAQALAQANAELAALKAQGALTLQPGQEIPATVKIGAQQ